MKFKDEFKTTCNIFPYDKWVNIHLDGEFDCHDGTENDGALSIDLPKEKAIEMAKEILKHFED